MAGQIAVDQIIEVRNTLRSVGIPVIGATYLFGDNKGLVQSSQNPTSILKKKHVFLLFSRICKAIVAEIIHLCTWRVRQIQQMH